jgi:hypothetical protein
MNFHPQIQHTPADQSIINDINTLFIALQNISNSIAHDEQAYQSAKANLPDLELCKSKLNRLVESLSR